MSCCRYLIIAFHPDIPPAETKAELPKVEKLAKHLSEKSLLMYVLVNFQTHLDHLGNSNEKIRDEFMNFVELLMKRSKSYASLLLGQWIRNLKWPTKLHVDETLARLYLHLFLLYASYTRKKKVTKLLLSFRSDLLHVEAGKGHPVTTKQLLENDTRVNPQSIIKWTPINTADEHEGILKFLLDLGVNVDSKDTDGRTPLSYAAETGHEGRFALLLGKGANINSNDVASRAPLSYAAEKGHKRIVQALINNGANIESKDTAGWTPLSYATKNGHKDLLKDLRFHGANIDPKDTAGRTPLSYAAENGFTAIFNELLFYRADVNSKGTTSRTPLSYAAENGHTSIVDVLLHREDVEFNSEDTSGRTPLSYAAENGHFTTVTFLLYPVYSNATYIKLKDTAGRTPLSYAAENGHTSIVRRFLQVDDIEFNSEDTTSQTPLSYATANGHTAVVELLQSHTTE